MSNNQHITKLKTWLSENLILVFIYLFALVFIGLFLFAPSSSQQMRILEEEFDVFYTTEEGVRRLMKSLNLSSLTSRPSHPRKEEEAVTKFKKNSHNS